MFKTPLIVLASLVTAGTILAGTASPALAAPPAAETRIVAYGDLDLSRSAGRAVLDARIDRAVRDVCGKVFVRDLNGLRLVELCRDETSANAYAQLRRGEVLVAGGAATLTISR